MTVVSVIIPVYNAEKYINKCIDSILNQTLKDIEVICVNDGSTDKSLQILNEYAMQDSRVRVVSQVNQGAGPARNKGIEISTGKYLAILDADDFFVLEMLEKLVEKAEHDSAEIVVFGSLDYNDVTKTIKSNKAALRMDMVGDVKTPFSKKELSEYIFNFTWGSAWNKLFLRSFVIEQGLRFQTVRLADDLYFTYLALAKANRISVLEEDLVYYRMANPNSQMGQTNKTPTEFFEAYYGLKLTLQREGLYEQVERSFVNRAIENCHYRLNMLTEYKPYEFLYQKLKDEYYDAFEFGKYSEDYFYVKGYYDSYKMIKEFSIGEYLFNRKCALEKMAFKSTKQESYKFPFEMIDKNSRIVLYGAGNVGNAYYRQIECSRFGRVVLWVDKKYKDYDCLVNAPEEICNVSYDKIIIAVADVNIAKDIRGYLISMGVEDDKIIWMKPTLTTK